jgi:hypothetical protein
MLAGTVKIGRQTKRAGIDHTLSVVVSQERGIALEQVSGYLSRYIYQNDVYNKGNTSFYSFINHLFIITLPLGTILPPFINYTPSINYKLIGIC